MDLHTFRITIILLFVFASCSTAEKSVEQPEEPEVTKEIESAVPEWFDESKFGYVKKDQIFSFGIASAANEKEAFDLAIEQSDVNMRTQLDYLFEEARHELVENNESSVDTPRFIRALRNSIQNIDLSGAEVQVETYRTDNNVIIAYIRKTITKEQAKNIVRREMQGENILNLFLNTGSLN